MHNVHKKMIFGSRNVLVPLLLSYMSYLGNFCSSSRRKQRAKLHGDISMLEQKIWKFEKTQFENLLHVIDFYCNVSYHKISETFLLQHFMQHFSGALYMKLERLKALCNNRCCMGVSLHSQIIELIPFADGRNLSLGATREVSQIYRRWPTFEEGGWLRDVNESVL